MADSIKNPLMSNQNQNQELQQNQNKDQSIAMKVYKLFEDPNSSNKAKHLSNFIVFLILLSIAVIILESVRDIQLAVSQSTWLALEIIITLIFTLEYLTRLIVCHKGDKTKLQFIFNLVNLCDLFSIMPLYIEWILGYDQLDTNILRTLRMVRIVRLLKLGKYCESLQLFATVMFRAKETLTIFFSLLLIALIFFASLVYVCEQGEYDEVENAYYLQNGQQTLYENIPVSLWWGIVTMTTVGYGDMFPITLAGKLIGSLAVITGIFVIVLPVGIVCNEFNKVYEEFQARKSKRLQSNTNLTDQENIELDNKEKEELQFLENLDQQNISGEDLQKIENTIEIYEAATKQMKELLQQFKNCI